ncbi:MAG TPA: hypothetical protein VJ276_07450 [Thermoanaerobaculia bacterium]|nr:hypothetical protein [Thermoanaerobaculia bacterium]
MRIRLLLAVLLLPLALHADEYDRERVRAEGFVASKQASLGLDWKNTVRAVEDGNRAMPRTIYFDQFYGGVRVDWGLLIVSFDERDEPEVTDKLVKDIDLDPKPRITATKAKSIAAAVLTPIKPDEPELLIVPAGTLTRFRRTDDKGPLPERDTLTWRVPLHYGPFRWEVFVDAHSGAVVFHQKTQMCGGPP